MASGERSKGQFFPASWGEPGGPFPPFRFSKAEWKLISKKAGITSRKGAARAAIEGAIGLYRRWEVNNASYASESNETRKELLGLQRDLSLLAKRLEEQRKNPDTLYELSTVSGIDVRQQLDDIQAGLESLAERIAGALRPQKRGPRTANVYWLVAELDKIRERFTGLQISRSYKDAASKEFIEAACKVANPSIGQGTIDAAMKHRIRMHGRKSV